MTTTLPSAFSDGAPAMMGTSKSRKAAMVVQLLLKDGGDLPLAELPERIQERLTRELGALNVIDKDTLNSVATEFAEEIDNVGLTPPGSVEAALNSLDGRISPATLARLREEAGAEGQDPWVSILALGAEDLLPITEAESPEVCAVLLSKLETSQAAELLGIMPGDRARHVAYAMSRTTGIRADAIARIGTGLAQQYCGAAVPAFADPPESRVGTILNATKAAVRDQILEGLLDEDEAFGTEVRKSIFTFADIATRVAVNDVPKIIRDIDGGDLVRALRSATEMGGGLAASAEHILDNMSSRMAENLREEMAELGKVKLPDAEEAQGAVVAAIRAASDAGNIIFVSDEDDDIEM